MAKDTQKAKEIGGRIRQGRQEAGGMTQRELADLLHVTERSVAAYERGEVIPYRFIRSLGEILSVDPAWLLHGDEATHTAEARKLDAVLAELQALRAEIEALRAERQ